MKTKSFSDVDIFWYGDDIKKACDDLIDFALEEIGMQVSSRASDLAPVDTGNLVASITYQVAKRIVMIGTNVEYAPYMEYGVGQVPPEIKRAKGIKPRRKKKKSRVEKTRGGRPQPYLRPALDQSRTFIKEKLQWAIDEGIKRGGGK